VLVGIGIVLKTGRLDFPKPYRPNYKETTVTFHRRSQPLFPLMASGQPSSLFGRDAVDNLTGFVLRQLIEMRPCPVGDALHDLGLGESFSGAKVDKVL
jgi:hypothetical protein